MKTIDDLLQENNIPVVVLDDQGRITFINEVFEREYGWKKDELLGQSVGSIIPASMRQAHHVGFSRFLTTGTPTLLGKPLQLPILFKNGQQKNAEHCIIAEKQDGKWRFAATISTPGKGV